MAKTAADIINQVRDLIPDGVYDASGVALPGTDGDLFRTQTLLRFIDDMVATIAQRSGWSVHDWYAMARVNGKPYYAVDEKWIDVHEAFSNMWPLDRIAEGSIISPTHPSQRPLWYGIHNRGSNLEVTFFPRPNVSDPATTLNGALLNNPTTAGVNFAVANGGTFVLFASDAAGMEFVSGATLSLTAMFSDGTSAGAVTRIP